MIERTEASISRSDTAHQKLKYLQEVQFRFLHPFEKMADVVLSDPAFVTAPGGASHHHDYEGGLVQHTAEVVEHILGMAGPGIDRPALLLAAIWHDYMKTREYVIEEDGTIRKTQYHARIGHVAGSYVEFTHYALRFGLSQPQIETIGHIMLAHHGRTEWRSPVEPQTPEAWLLHAADMLSARGGK